jgi:hypothetical protein
VTLLIGAEHRGRVHLIGDSISIDGDEALNVVDTAKVWRSGEWVIGVAGSWRVLGLFRWRLSLPRLASEANVEEVANTEVVDAMQSVLRDAGYDVNDEKGEVSWECLIGARGSVFYTDASLGFVHPRDGVAAAGQRIVAAAGVAALRAQRPWKKGVEHALRRAAEAAEEGGTSVRGPFLCVSA